MFTHSFSDFCMRNRKHSRSQTYLFEFYYNCKLNNVTAMNARTKNVYILHAPYTRCILFFPLHSNIASILCDAWWSFGFGFHVIGK